VPALSAVQRTGTYFEGCTLHVHSLAVTMAVCGALTTLKIKCHKAGLVNAMH